MKILQTQLTIITCILLLPIICYAEWSTVLQAKGQRIDGLYRSSIRIGEASTSIYQPAPPQAPNFSCAIVIHSDDWQSRLSVSVKGESDSKEWIFSVNPCGNACGIGEASTTVYWNPEQIGDSVFEIREGYDGTGPIVVADMKKSNQLTVTGANEPYYYTIIKQ